MNTGRAQHLLTKVIYIALLVIISPSSSLANTDAWLLSIGGLHGKGHSDGLRTPSEWVIVPFTLKYRRHNWNTQVTSSYIRADTFSPNDTPSYSGQGDTFLKATYLLPSPLFQFWWVDLSGKIKFPTANEQAGLGTGKMDFWFDVEAMRTLSRGWFEHLAVGKKFRGNHAESNLVDSYYFNSSLGKRWRKRYTTGIQLEFMEAAAEESEEVIETMLYTRCRFSPQNSLLLYLVKGFTHSSTEKGIGFQFTRRFQSR
ncbi:MAG: hypothetical protein KUG83_07740 [Gammaproteobacteria bacterium]|nr:hypothetical protein [Gammaproteobacteria bacterium]